MKIICTEKEKEKLEFVFSTFDEEGICPLPGDLCIDTFLCKDCIMKSLSIEWEIV